MDKIGFIGLGVMGKPMALNLLTADYELLVHDSRQEPVDELVNRGAVAAANPQEVAEQSEVVITMLPDSPDVEDVVFGDSGLLHGVSTGMLFIDMSTIAPSVSRKISEIFRSKGVDTLDAPVSGGDVGAQQGTLSIMVGGSEKAFERASPIFNVLGKNIVLIGEAGAGQVTKACNQVVVAQTIQAVAEAMTLAKKSGVDQSKVRDALLGGFAQSRILDLHGKRVLERNFQPGFRTELHRKDLNIALQTARDIGLALPATGLVAELMNALIAQGKGKLDHSALTLLMEQLGNIGE
jgi:2-hydroxy-3-oxopropionate reductase